MYTNDATNDVESLTTGGRFRLQRSHVFTWFVLAIALFLAGFALGESDSLTSSAGAWSELSGV